MIGWSTIIALAIEVDLVADHSIMGATADKVRKGIVTFNEKDK